MLTANTCSGVSYERAFAGHMFAKHSFGVKHFGASPPDETPLSHPSRRLILMTAATLLPRPFRHDAAEVFARAPQTTFVPRRLVGDPGRAEEPTVRMPVTPTGVTRPRVSAHHAPVRSTPVRPAAGVYRRRRLLAVGLLAGVIIGLVSFVREAEANPTPEGRLADSVTVVVESGDSLWSLAASLAPGQDRRAVVSALERIAGGADLQPGQVLVIPRRALD